MMPDKSSSWFLWVEERQKEYLKKKKWERETLQMLYFRGTFLNDFLEKQR